MLNGVNMFLVKVLIQLNINVTEEDGLEVQNKDGCSTMEIDKIFMFTLLNLNTLRMFIAAAKMRKNWAWMIKPKLLNKW